MSKKKVLLKVIILGDSGVGKTALLHKYVHGQFIEEHKATIGADFLTKEVVFPDKVVTLQVWDTAGQERFQSLGTAFYRGADACVLVYDVTNEESFKQIETWRSNFLDQASPQNTGDFPFLLLGNKTDLTQDRVVEQGQGKALADKHRMKFFETSALNGHNVETAIREIASHASEQETVPVFSQDVVDKIQFVKDNKEPPKEEPGCACSLL
jgi:Ras-related protein Rab-7A